MITDINSEDRLVQRTFAGYLRDELRWESLYAWQEETFGPNGTLGRGSEREVVLVRDLRAALARLNPDLPESAHEQAVEKLTRVDFSRSLVQHNREFHGYIRRGVPVEWRAAKGATHRELAQVIDFRSPTSDRNRFLAVRELKIQGVRVPHYNRRADLVCFVNGLPLVFIELKAVYKNIRAGFDNNLTDYLDEHSIAHAFHHNALLVVSNGDRARYGSITSRWEHFVEWKRNDEKALGRLDAQVLLDGILAKDRLLDLVESFILFDDSRPGGTRKIVARNHQVLGVNNAVAAVRRQEELKRQFPPERRVAPPAVTRNTRSAPLWHDSKPGASTLEVPQPGGHDAVRVPTTAGGICVARRPLQVVVDPEIGDSDRIFVSYFTLCRQIHWEPMVLRFDQMPAAVYAKEYPVSVRFAVATGFRGKRGTHALRIDLVNAATRVSREVVRMDVESRSSSVVTELHGDLAFPIPEPGIYFVSLVINESRVATAILPAETPAAEWSYALRPEDAARVEGGELLALLRGSQTEEEAREARGQTSA